MKIDKAIETLNEDINHPTAQFMPDLQEAQKLGIEALKRVKEARTRVYFITRTPLPGETE